MSPRSKNCCESAASKCPKEAPFTFDLDTCQHPLACICLPEIRDSCAHGKVTARFNPCKGPHGVVQFTGYAGGLSEPDCDNENAGAWIVLRRADCQRRLLHAWPIGELINENNYDRSADCHRSYGWRGSFDFEYVIPHDQVAEDLRCGAATLEVANFEEEWNWWCQEDQLVEDRIQAHGIVCLSEDCCQPCAFKPSACCRKCQKFECTCKRERHGKKDRSYSDDGDSYADKRASYGASKCNKCSRRKSFGWSKGSY